MNARFFAISAIALGSLLLAAGCAVTAEPTGEIVTVAPADIAVVCSADNAPCVIDADCCSYLCAPDGACGVPVTSCEVDNDRCDFDSDCCSGICAGDGFCGIP
jgi:hypothetical protein